MEGSNSDLSGIGALSGPNIHISFTEIRVSAFAKTTGYITISKNDASTYPTFIENNRI